MSNYATICKRKQQHSLHQVTKRQQRLHWINKIEKACKYKETCTKCFTANSSYLQTTFYGLHINSGLVNDLVKELMNKVRYVNE